MSKKAFLFPGQGAQFVGMGKDLCDHPEVRRLYKRANEILGFDISNLCFTGPETELNKTDISQPAILVTSLAMLEVYKEKPDYAEPDAAAGLSLGEYTALVAVGALSFDDAVHLVERRGTFMQKACEVVPGGMASVIGFNKEAIKNICASVGGIVVIANLNGPQVVISGENNALAEATAKIKAAGAKRVIPLKVAGAFHSPLMEVAEKKLREELEKINIQTPRRPVISNVTAGYVRTPDEIKTCLARQVTSPVLWEDSMRRLIAEGFSDFYEIGPGNVLTSLMQRIESSVKCHPCS